MPLASVLFFRFRLSRPNISTLVEECLRGLQQGDARQFKQSHPNVLVVRFLPFEKELLSRLFEFAIPAELLEEAKHPLPLDPLAFHLFFRWSWASDVLRQILAEFNPTNSFGAPSGTQAREWTQSKRFQMFKTLLRNRFEDFGHDTRHARTDQLVEDNREFVSHIGEINWENITIQPHPDDLVLWRALAFLFQEQYTTLRNWPGFRAVVNELESSTTTPWEQLEDHHDEDSFSIVDAEMNEDSDATSTIVGQIRDVCNVWDVWTLCRSIRQQGGAKAESLLDDFVASTAFARHWKTIKILVDEENYLLGFLPQKKLELKAPSSISKFFADDIMERISVEYHQTLFNRPLPDLQQLLRFIDWEELEDVDPANVEDLLDELGMGRPVTDGASCKVWMKLEGSVLFHTLYLTEDLYTHHVLDGYRYPGLCLRDQVVFRCRELEETCFCEELRRFWADWNDVAITLNPHDHKFYLLETLPGVKARILREENSDRPLSFFDMKWRFRDSLAEQHEMLKEALGTHYDPSYRDFAMFIRSEEFDFARSKDIGKGRFGRVYCVPRENKSLKNFSLGDEHAEEVAVKIPRNDNGSSGGLAFFQELRNVFKALGGNNLGCVEFCGFTKAPVDRNNILCSPSAPNFFGFTLALVFDYASEGQLFDHFRKKLHPGQLVGNWKAICNSLEDLANGLRTIHNHGIIHRDLHPGNVLVQRKHHQMSDTIEYSTLLSDLGEGKAIETSLGGSTLPRTSDGISLEQYSPPEILNRGHAGSFDIFAWAQLAVDIVRLNHSALLDDQGTVKYPAKLMTVVEDCLNENPEERYTAAELVIFMEEIGKELVSGNASKVEWTEGNYELSRIALRLESSLELPSSWSKRT